MGALKYFVLFGVAAVAFAQKGTGTGYGYGEEYGMEQCDGRANDLLMMVCTAQAPLFSANSYQLCQHVAMAMVEKARKSLEDKAKARGKAKVKAKEKAKERAKEKVKASKLIKQKNAPLLMKLPTMQ